MQHMTTIKLLTSAVRSALRENEKIGLANAAVENKRRRLHPALCRGFAHDFKEQFSLLLFFKYFPTFFLYFPTFFLCNIIEQH